MRVSLLKREKDFVGQASSKASTEKVSLLALLRSVILNAQPRRLTLASFRTWGIHRGDHQTGPSISVRPKGPPCKMRPQRFFSSRIMAISGYKLRQAAQPSPTIIYFQGILVTSFDLIGAYCSLKSKVFNLETKCLPL